MIIKIYRCVGDGGKVYFCPSELKEASKCESKNTGCQLEMRAELIEEYDCAGIDVFQEKNTEANFEAIEERRSENKID